MAVSELAATATATAGSLRRHALKYRTPLATPLATVVAAAVATNSDTAYNPVAQSTDKINADFERLKRKQCSLLMF